MPIEGPMVFEDREVADDGGCYVTIFAGPMAQLRARAYGDALTVGVFRIIEATAAR